MVTQSDAKTLYTVIVPVYNEERGLRSVLEELLALRQEHRFEVIAVDDGSTDGSAGILESYASCIKALRHPSNRGYGAALKTGIREAETENVVFFDSDGQHQACYLPAIFDKLQNHEFVIGIREDGSGVPAVRRPGKWLLAKTCNFLAAQKIPDINCGLRGGRRHLYLQMLDLLPDGFSFATTSLLHTLKSRFSYTYIPVVAREREGSSSVRIVYDGLKTLLLIQRLIMLFDPMRALGYPALALLAFGVLYQVWIFCIHGLHIEGAAIVALVSGLMLFIFGLLADQVASLRKEISSQNSLLIEHFHSMVEATATSPGQADERTGEE